MKATGTYMFLGNINSMFGPGLRFADTLTKLKLRAYEKDDIKEGNSALFVSRDGKIVRVYASGVAW
jgi:hypothetical protein